jgi:hypothetical protein
MRRAPDRVGRQDHLPLGLEEPLVVGDLLDEILSLRRYQVPVRQVPVHTEIVRGEGTRQILWCATAGITVGRRRSPSHLGVQVVL